MQVTSLLLCVSPAEESPDVSLMTLRLGERPSRKKTQSRAGRTQTAPWRTATSHLACENLEMLENVFGHPPSPICEIDNSQQFRVFYENILNVS